MHRYSIVCIFVLSFLLSHNLFAQDLSDTLVADDSKNEENIEFYMFSWSWDPLYRNKQKSSVDTSLINIHNNSYYYKQKGVLINNGPLGSASRNQVFYLRELSSPFLFDQNYKPFIHNIQNCKFNNTTKPFTLFGYSFFPGEKEHDEQSVKLLFTQNVNQTFNVGMDIDFVGSKGYFGNQVSKAGNYSLFSSIFKPRYSNYSYATLNNLDLGHNGGIENVEDLVDSTINNKSLIPVRSTDAYASMKNVQIFFSQQFDLKQVIDSISNDSLTFYDNKKPYFGFFNTLEYNSNSRFFLDNSLSPKEDTIYNYSLDSIRTFDTVSNRTITAKIGVNINRGVADLFSLNANGSLFAEFDHYYSGYDSALSKINYHSLYGHTENFFNTGYNFNLIGRFAKFRMSFSGNQYIGGYKGGDGKYRFSFDQTFSKDSVDFMVVSAYAKYSETVQSWFYNGLIANNRNWDKIPNRRMKTLEFNGEIDLPVWNISAGVDNMVMNDFLHFVDYKPVIESDVIGVLTLYLRNDFSFWKFLWNNEMYYQTSNKSDLLSIPAFAAKTTFSFHHDFYFKLTEGGFSVQIGTDVMYNSPYRTSSYLPMFEQYSINNYYQSGDFYYINPFFNVKIKRLSAYFKYTNVLSLINKHVYIPVSNYPSFPAILKWGILWTFYD